MSVLSRPAHDDRAKSAAGADAEQAAALDYGVSTLPHRPDAVASIGYHWLCRRTEEAAGTSDRAAVADEGATTPPELTINTAASEMIASRRRRR